MATTLLRNLYYDLKPVIPRTGRVAMRRWQARRARRRCLDSWPIDEAAGKAPDGWRGWPDGQQFCFVLTHDVEGLAGISRCAHLAGLEMELGFRSSFNFVPEGEYETPDVLRTFLVEQGFEVGVHDLHHDGKLYRSRSAFAASARRINEYLADWHAAGFRSAFMLHNLGWIGDLNILYDASTFDTDPFEPQPDGVGTIFPFRVMREDGSSYVELPYTLPQDSTLFNVLEETTIDVWKRKLDWVAARGGLALVNVHPDYVTFRGRGRELEYSVDFYRRFLEYVRHRYDGACWFALPRDVAAHHGLRLHVQAAGDARPPAR
jgi:hypothetical protein